MNKLTMKLIKCLYIIIIKLTKLLQLNYFNYENAIKFFMRLNTFYNSFIWNATRSGQNVTTEFGVKGGFNMSNLISVAR